MAYLDGKTIAVTGAGRGIGRCVALACAAAGANVVVNDYGVSIDGNEPDSEIANAVVAEITAAGGNAIAVADSVTTMEGGARIVQSAVDTYGTIDGVVCVAGILRERMLFNMSDEEWDDVIRVHLRGTFSLFRPASAVMRKQGSGSLISFTSGVWALGSVAQANYAAAKAGMIGLARTLARELGADGVTVNVVAPGMVRTEMTRALPADRLDAARDETLLGRLAEADDVAQVVTFLCSAAARHVTGAVLPVDGGQSL